jgi:uncharacterized protein YybS (DUF2232 family)
MRYPLINYIISILFFATNLIFPQVGFILTLFAPIFVLKYLMDERASKTDHFMALTLTVILGVFSLYLLFYFVFLCVFPSLVINYFFKQKNDYKVDVIVIASLPIFLMSLFIIFFMIEYKNSIISYMVQYLDMIIENYKNTVDNFQANSYLSYISKNKEMIATTFVHLMPSISFVYASFLTLILRKYYFRKTQMLEVRYRVNEKLVYLFIIGGFFILSKNVTFKFISYNTLIIFAALFFYQGLDIVNYYFNKWKSGIFLRVIVYLLIFSEPYVMLLISIFGLFDNWFDMTKIRLKKDKT